MGAKELRVVPGVPKNGTPPYGKGDPYYSHTIPTSLWILMGVVWEQHGFPLLLGVPENPIEGARDDVFSYYINEEPKNPRILKITG